MEGDRKRLFRASQPVPMKWFLVGCAVILGIGALAAVGTSPGVMILAMGGCAAWWFIFLIIVEKDYLNWSIGRVFDSSARGNSTDRLGLRGFSSDETGVTNINGLPTDGMGIDSVGNVFGTDAGDD